MHVCLLLMHEGTTVDVCLSVCLSVCLQGEVKKNGKKKYLVVGNKFITYYPSHSVSAEGGQEGGGGLTVEGARLCDCSEVLWFHSAVTVTLSSRLLVLGLSGLREESRESGCVQ